VVGGLEIAIKSDVSLVRNKGVDPHNCLSCGKSEIFQSSLLTKEKSTG
jgi:hypothetical protein